MIFVKRQQADPVLAKDQLQAIQATLQSWGVEAFLQSFFWILAKAATAVGDQTSRLVPFSLNRIQRHLEPRLGVNNIVGKGRQQGFTTYMLLRRLLLPVITEGGIGSLLIGQTAADASTFLRIAIRAYRYIAVVDPFDASQNEYSVSLKQNLLHTAFSNKKELVFDYLDSKVMIASAEVEEAGQGVTLHHILADEYARWPGDPRATLANARGALVPGGTVDKSSTANGMVGPYFQDFLLAMDYPKESDSKVHFYAHWMTEEYLIEMTEEEKDEMEADLTADELRVVAKIRKDLEETAYVA